MNLTPREIEVLEAIRAGARSYPAIARELGISRRTAEAHVCSISEKLPEPSQGTPQLQVVIYALSASTGSPE